MAALSPWRRCYPAPWAPPPDPRGPRDGPHPGLNCHIQNQEDVLIRYDPQDKITKLSAGQTYHYIHLILT